MEEFKEGNEWGGKRNWFDENIT